MNDCLNLLPDWLSAYIVNSGAEYSADHVRVMFNLENNHQDNLKYLGTYFPRSFIEIKSICMEIDRLTSHFTFFEEKKSFKLLSVGCGTGGDIASLVCFLHARYPEAEFEINVIDGNEDALNICRDIFKQMHEVTGTRIIIKRGSKNIRSTSDFYNLAYNFSDMDFIVTSKFLCELLTSCDNVYYHFAKAFSASLSERGMMIISDVTCTAANGIFIPLCMNSDLNDFTDASEFSFVLPIPCRNHKHCKNHSCYTKFQHPDTNSKYNYRVLVRDSVARSIMPEQTAEHLISLNEEIRCAQVSKEDNDDKIEFDFGLL